MESLTLECYRLMYRPLATQIIEGEKVTNVIVGEELNKGGYTLVVLKLDGENQYLETAIWFKYRFDLKDWLKGENLNPGIDFYHHLSMLRDFDHQQFMH